MLIEVSKAINETKAIPLDEKLSFSLKLYDEYHLGFDDTLAAQQFTLFDQAFDKIPNILTRLEEIIENSMANSPNLLSTLYILEHYNKLPSRATYLRRQNRKEG